MNKKTKKNENFLKKLFERNSNNKHTFIDSFNNIFNKLSKREKILLGLLGIVIIVFSYYKFIIIPSFNEINILKEKIQKYKSEYEEMGVDISSLDNLDNNYKVLNVKITMLENGLFSGIIQEKIIEILDEMLNNSGLDGKSIVFSDIAKDSVFQEKNSEDNEINITEELVNQYFGILSDTLEKESESDSTKKDEEINQENKDIKVDKMTVTIDFEGTYAELMNFIYELENYSKKIIINEIKINSNYEENILQGNIALDFFAIKKLHTIDEEYGKWDYDNEYGRENPFHTYTGYQSSKGFSSNTIDNINTNNNGNKNVLKEDFIMTVKPITADIPTIIIGNAKDREMKTYVYADNEKYEKVTFEIFEENNKYFYRYKTEKDSYPQDYENDRSSFKPDGNEVNLIISSYPRNGIDDKNGADLTLINNTDLKLNVSIEREDPKEERVRVQHKEGVVIINYK